MRLEPAISCCATRRRGCLGARFAMFAFAVAALCAFPQDAAAQGELATLQPTFQESGHVPPVPTTPPARSPWAGYVDVLLLIAALAAASYLALKARSRRGLVALSVLCLLYFGFWRKGCVCPVGSIQNVTQALIDPGYAVPLVVVLFFAMPLLFTLFCGRTFCAAVCPLGTIQDVMVLRPMKVPSWAASVLGLVPYLYLGLTLTLVAGGGGYLICRYDPFVGFFRFGASFQMLVLGGSRLALSMVVGRPYCRFLCPYAVLLNWCSRLSRRHVTITPGECVRCRLCEDSCPFGAILAPTPEKLPEPRGKAIRRLTLLLLLMPVLVAGGGFLGSRMGVPVSRLSDTVRLAERLYLEQSGRAEWPTIETEGYLRTRESPRKLYDRALEIRRRVGRGGWFLGGFMGLVIGSRLLSLAVFPRRSDYLPHRGECVSCARCFRYCPKENERLKKRETCGE